LGSCLIDQLATFAYNVPENGDHRYHYELFIKQYFNKYRLLGEQLYKSLRCKLVHGYTIDRFLKIMSQSEIIDDDERHTHANALTAKMLHKELHFAWEKLYNKLLIENSPERKNAIEKFNNAPPLMESKYQIFRYKKDEAEYLRQTYESSVIGKLINNNSQLIITSLEVHQFIGEISDNPNDEYIVIVVAKKSKTERYTEYLEETAIRLNMEHPFEFLKKNNLLY
jgi:hypothetical protein